MKTRTLAKWFLAGLTVLLTLTSTGCDLFGLFGEPTGLVEGTIVDVTSGGGIADVEIAVEDESRYSATSESDGSFSIEVPVGTQVLIFTRSGFSFPNYEVTVTEDSTTTIPQSEVVGSPALEAGDFRFVLTWGANPDDLDSHLLTPNGQHVYYSDQTPMGAGALLDVDDVTSYGPETVTITDQQPGTYVYYVHRYSGTGTLAGSNALVRVFDSTGEVVSFTAPTTGTGDYWKVFTLNNTTITPVNVIQSGEPTL